MPVLVSKVEVNNKKKGTISPKKNILSYIQNKSRYWSASLTVEASLIVPMFFFLIFFLWQIFLLLMFQLKVCEQTTQSILEYSHLGYIEQTMLKDDVDMSWIYETLLWTSFPDHENVRGRWIDCKMQEDETILVNISYSFLCESIFFPKFSLPIVQTFQFYPYFGVVDTDLLVEKEEEKDVVYMTEHGTVYHVSKTCVYLNVRLKSISISNLSEVRNSFGQRYTECSKCNTELKTDQVYISVGGNKYHWSLKCPAMKRNIIEKTKEEVKGVSACRKCGKDKEENVE